MSKESFYLLQISSTLSAVFPLVIGFLRFSKWTIAVRLFVIFLAVGFSTDVLGWYFYLTANGSANIIVRNGYNLIEPIFLFWLVSQFSTAKIIKLILANAWIALIPFWALGIFKDNFFALFKTTTEVLLAFAASFGLLGLIEQQEHSTSDLPFWLLLGIFFYNFSTFFFMSLVTSKIGFNLWYLHNIINVATNLIFFCGFWKGFRSDPTAIARRPIL